MNINLKSVKSKILLILLVVFLGFILFKATEVEAVAPDITWVTPASDNSTKVKGSITLNITISDTNLYLANVTIYENNCSADAVQKFTSYIENLTTTSYQFTNTTGNWGDNDYCVKVTAGDWHTNGNLDNLKKGKRGENILLFGEDDVINSTINITFLEKKDKAATPPSDLKSFIDEVYNNKSELIAYKWGLNFTANKKGYKPKFVITSPLKIKYAEPYTNISGHLIWGGNRYYHDFSSAETIKVNGQNVSATIETTIIDDYTVEIIIRPSKNIKKNDSVEIDPELGALNIVRETSKYEEDYTAPAITYQGQTPANASRQTANSITVNVTVSEIPNVCLLQIGVDGSFNNYSMTISGTECNYSLATTDGKYYNFTVFANDAVGNINNSLTRNFLENTAPSLSLETSNNNITIDITPDFAINCSDAESGDTSSLTLYINGVPYGTNSSVTNSAITYITANDTLSKDIYSWNASCYDGYETTYSATRTMTIADTPSISSVDVTPDTAYTNSTLTCTPSGTFIDSYTYAWYNNSVLLSRETSSTLSSQGFDVDDVINCTAYGTNTTLNLNTDISSDKVTISNLAPSLTSISYTPSSPNTNQSITFNTTVTDIDSVDSGSLIVYCEIYNNSVYFATDTFSSLANNTVVNCTITSWNTTKGEQWSVNMTANDGTENGTLKASAILTISNSVPGAPTIDLTPNSPVTTDTLYCNVTTNSTDADDDAVNYTYEWYNNSVLFKSTRNTGTLYDTVGNGNTTKGEVWNCTVIPNDGTVNGAKASDTVTIGNTAPNISIESPADYYNSSNSTPTFGVNCSDIDVGDTLELTLYINNTPYGTNSSVTNRIITNITANTTLNDGAYYWNASCSDGTAISYSSTRTITIDATAPTISDFRISTSSGYTDTAYSIYVNCSDNNNLTNSSPKVSFYNPSGSLVGNFSMTSDTGDRYVKTYTFSTTGTYTNFSVFCRDVFGNEAQNLSSQNILNFTASIRPSSGTTIGGGGGGATRAKPKTPDMDKGEIDIKPAQSETKEETKIIKDASKAGIEAEKPSVEQLTMINKLFLIEDIYWFYIFGGIIILSILMLSIELIIKHKKKKQKKKYHSRRKKI